MHRISIWKLHFCAAVALVLFSLEIPVQLALAEPIALGTSRWTKSGLEKACVGEFVVESSGKFSCNNIQTSISIDCWKSGDCLVVCSAPKCANASPNGGVNSLPNSLGANNGIRGAAKATMSGAGVAAPRTTGVAVSGGSVPGVVLITQGVAPSSTSQPNALTTHSAVGGAMLGNAAIGVSRTRPQ